VANHHKLFCALFRRRSRLRHRDRAGRPGCPRGRAPLTFARNAPGRFAREPAPVSRAPFRRRGSPPPPCDRTCEICNPIRFRYAIRVTRRPWRSACKPSQSFAGRERRCAARSHFP